MPSEPVLTTCPEAAEQYRQGLELLLADGPAAATPSFRAAVGHDPGFALAHAGLGAVTADVPSARAAIVRARECPRRVSRRERQQIAIIELALTGLLPRASALGREHLNEFPDDVLIRYVLAARCEDVTDLVER